MNATSPFHLHEPSAVAPSGARTVAGIHRGSPMHWVGDGFRVSTVFPSTNVAQERVSPFLMLDFHPSHVYAPHRGAPRGVGWHPHRGFETVTIAWQGAIAHRDNAGHSGIIGPGDVQWMTAGSGILHEEYHEPEYSQRGGAFEMVQLWINLPKRHKMTRPDYQSIESAEIPVVALGQGSSQVRIIAGEFEGRRGPARTFSPVTLLDAHIARGATLTAPLPMEHHALALVASGRLVANQREARTGDLVLFGNDGTNLEFAAEDDAHVLVLAGEPIAEPIVQYGPFVMNTRGEIAEAMRDLQSGGFGELPSSF